jgi:hypothetical protein
MKAMLLTQAGERPIRCRFFYSALYYSALYYSALYYSALY